MAFWATLPISTGDRYITARVSDATSSTIVVADVGGASAPVYDALNGQAQGFVVYDFHTGTKTTPSTGSGQAPSTGSGHSGGNWTETLRSEPILSGTLPTGNPSSWTGISNSIAEAVTL